MTILEAKPKPHLSPSSMDTLSRCGEAWRRRYVEREIIPPAIVMVQGTGVHKGAATNFRQKLASHVDLPADEIVDAAVAAFDEELASGDVSLTDEERGIAKDLLLGASRDQVAELARLHATQVAPEYQPAMVEEKIRVVMPNASHDLVGVLDLADDKDRVIDHKVSGKRKQQDEADNSVQLTYYAAAHAVATGKIASEVRLEVLVKTKTPARQTLVSQRGTADFQALVNRANMALKVIEAGAFMPATPGAWWCSNRFCGYYASCRFVNAERRALAEESAKSEPPVAAPARSKSQAQVPDVGNLADRPDLPAKTEQPPAEPQTCPGCGKPITGRKTNSALCRLCRVKAQDASASPTA